MASRIGTQPVAVPSPSRPDGRRPAAPAAPGGEVGRTANGWNPVNGDRTTLKRAFLAKFTPADAAAVATAWHMSQNDAMVMLGDKLRDPQMGQAYVANIIADAKKPAGQSDTDAAVGKFLTTYTYADAQAVAKAWGIDTNTAKASIGQKLLDMGKPKVDQLLASLRPPVQGLLELKSSAIEEVGADQKFPTVAGYKLSTKELNYKESVPLADGKKADFDYESESITAKGPDGKTRNLIGPNAAVLEQAKADFHDEFKPGQRLEEFVMPERSSYTNYSYAGSAGKTVSVRGNYSSYSGGAHPNNGTDVRVFDLKTGKQLTLDKLLTKAQFDSIVAVATDQLNRLPEGELYQPEAATFAEGIANGFALSKGADGKAQIEVSLPSYVHALGGMHAHLVFDAPTDAAFKQKVGLD